MPRAIVTIIGKPGCHLCDDARDVIDGVVAELRGAQPRGSDPRGSYAQGSVPGGSDASLEIVVKELSILDDSELYDEHVEDIPVILINGKVHTFWRVDPARLTTALRGVR